MRRISDLTNKMLAKWPKDTAKQGAGSVLVLVHVWNNVPELFVAIICLYCLLIIIGIILNGLVCYVMIKTKRYLKNVSCFFITHMAVVDLFYRVVFTPLVVYMSLPTKVVHSPIPCKISAFASSTCAAAIFASLVVIAVDRYRNIIHPLTSLKKKKRLFLMVVLVWFYAIASSFIFLYTAYNVPLKDIPEAKEIDLVGSPTSCDIIPGDLGGLSVTISAVMIFIVPLGFLIITYTAIFVSLRRRCQKGLVHKFAAKSKAKAARMLIMVVIGFVVCYGPSIILQALRPYRILEDTDIKSLVIGTITTEILQLCSSLCNPVIYAIYSADFKKDLRKTCGGFCRNCTSFLNQKVAGTRASTATRSNFITTSF